MLFPTLLPPGPILFPAFLPPGTILFPAFLPRDRPEDGKGEEGVRGEVEFSGVGEDRGEGGGACCWRSSCGIITGVSLNSSV